MTTYNMDIEYNGVLFEDAEITFDIEVETNIAEPYSWGESRGTKTTVRAEFISAIIGTNTISREQIEPFIGKSGLWGLEDSAETRYSEAEEAGL